jgi:two-component SAPR family response regulator
MSPQTDLYRSDRSTTFKDAMATVTTADTLYFEPQGEVSSVWNLLSEMAGSYSDQNPDVALFLTTLSEGITPEEAANRFLVALKKAKTKTVVFASLDLIEFDTETTAFLRTLVTEAPKKLDFLFEGREVEYPFWKPLVEANKVVPHGTGTLFQTDKEHHLTIKALGGTRTVRADGKFMNEWDGPLPYFLFMFMVTMIARTGQVYRDDIFAVIWALLALKEATNVFHVTKRKVSERMLFEISSYGNGMYKFAENVHVEYDVARFEEVLIEAEKSNDDAERLNLLAEAIHLYRGPFMYGFEENFFVKGGKGITDVLKEEDVTKYEWLMQVRTELRDKHLTALVQIARLYAKLGDKSSIARAINSYALVLKETPEREDAARGKMRLLAQTGKFDEAIAVYEALADHLHANLHKLSPSPMTEVIRLEVLIQRSVEESDMETARKLVQEVRKIAAANKSFKPDAETIRVLGLVE